MTPQAKLFTVEEAERTLPLVRRIVADLMAEYPLWRAAVAKFELIAGGTRAEAGESPEAVTVRQQVARHADRINEYLRELEAVGCVFKGFEAGLVDFHSLRDGRTIFLCWKLDEPRITHWHEVDAGFAGRQPIAPATFSAPHS